METTLQSKNCSTHTSSVSASRWPRKSSAHFALAWVTIALVGCGDGTSDRDASTPAMDASRPDGGGPDGSATSDAGPPGCASDDECDDGVDCTADTCTSTTGACRHQVVPALCPAGSSCHPVRGCEMGRPCGTDADCEDEDACRVNERCDPAARTCVTDPLDGDGDGDPPRVCGGGDCDDSRASVYTGAPELCDELDNDCDTRIDEGVVAGTCALCRTASECGHEDMRDCYERRERQLEARGCLNGDAIRAAWETCAIADCTAYLACRDDASASCECSARSGFCDTSPVAYCIDFARDERHCGACGNICIAGTTCESGVCRCAAGQTLCGSACVDTGTNAMHCGGCGRPCPTGASCIAGTCVCSAGGTACGSACVDTGSDASNCGTCGHTCPFGVACSGGTCLCPAGTTECPARPGVGPLCADLATDVYNCGACGNECPRAVPCVGGSCET